MKRRIKRNDYYTLSAVNVCAAGAILSVYFAKNIDISKRIVYNNNRRNTGDGNLLPYS